MQNIALKLPRMSELEVEPQKILKITPEDELEELKKKDQPFSQYKLLNEFVESLIIGIDKEADKREKFNNSVEF